MEILSKITNSTRNTYTLKILETPRYLILNDQLYDKSNLNPLKFEVLDNNDITFTSWTFVLKRFIFTNYRNTNRYFEQLVLSNNYGMVEDIKYPNRFYIIGQRTTCSGFLKIFEETTDENTGKIYFKNLKEFNIDENAWTHTWNYCGGNCAAKEYYCGGYSIIHQEDDYLLIKQHYPVAWSGGSAGNTWNWRGDVYAGNRCTLFKLNKNDFSTFSISDVGNINEDASYNYFYMEHWVVFDYIFINWHLNHYVLKFDSSRNTVVTIYDNPETGCDITANPVKIGDYYYYLVDEYKRTGNYGYQLCKLKINKIIEQNGTCDYEYIDIEDNYKMDIDRSSAMANVTHPLIHQCHTIHTNTADYMIIIARSQPNGEWYYTQHKIVVLRIEEDKAIITQVIELKANPCRGCLTYYEEPGHADVLITLHTSCIKIWKFDYEQEKYVDTFTKSGIFYAMGLDEQQRLYLQDSSTGIQVFDKIETSTAKVYFKNNIVNEDENTTILCFWTKNYFNEYTSENVIINLYNGITFEDGTIEKEFMTSSSGPTEINVLITATSNVRAQATIAVTSRTSAPEEPEEQEEGE